MRPAQKQVKKGVRHLNSHPLSRNHHDQGLNGNAKQRQNIPEFSHLTTSGNGISEVPVTAELLHAPVAQEGDTFFVQTNRRASFCGNEAERSTSGKWFPQVPTEKVALTLEEAKTVLGECSRMGDMLQGIFEDFLCASPADAGNKEADDLSMDGEAGSHERSTAGTGTISITMSGKWGKVDSSANGVHSPVGPARDEASASIASPLVFSSPLKSDAKKRERELIGETSMTCQAGEESSSGEVLPKEELSCNTYHGGADSPLVTGQTDEEDQGRQRLPKVDSTGGAKNSALKNELLKCQATCEEVAMKMLNQYIQAEKDDVQEQKALAALHLRAGQDLRVSGSNLQLDSDLLTAACGDLLDSRQIIKSTFQQISDESNEPTADTTNARRSYLAPTKSVQNRLRCTRTLGGLK
ncbi:hypothetical protein TGGT1_217915 [Toxoplasma gondii GT1]|uniref:Uncharacterized protein n=2 Tax=Toxoplasma gondii TaxID=5811 RepID=S7WHG6_TOXGG|nr:hypothetical protein TGGT1_217915 [Toxoplasma gondii GT1]RQX71866.1 hypothetical protein TGCAST_217915 [Toxoplasma gondii CAST]